MSGSILKETERRKNRRYTVQENVFAVFRLGSKSSSLVSIADISRGGFAFTFMGMDDIHRDRFELDIFVSGDGRRLDKLPFKIISSTPQEKEAPVYTLTKKRFGARFYDLSDTKALQLASFINSHKIMDNLPDTPA